MKNKKPNTPPQTLAELEQGSTKSRSLQIGLRHLILYSNVLSVIIAVIAWTNGVAIFLLIPIAFALPLIVCAMLFLAGLIEKATGTVIGAKPFLISQNPKSDSPFDD